MDFVRGKTTCTFDRDNFQRLWFMIELDNQTRNAISTITDSSLSVTMSFFNFLILRREFFNFTRKGYLYIKLIWNYTEILGYFSQLLLTYNTNIPFYLQNSAWTFQLYPFVTKLSYHSKFKTISFSFCSLHTLVAFFTNFFVFNFLLIWPVKRSRFYNFLEQFFRIFSVSDPPHKSIIFYHPPFPIKSRILPERLLFGECGISPNRFNNFWKIV